MWRILTCPLPSITSGSKWKNVSSSAHYDDWWAVATMNSKETNPKINRILSTRNALYYTLPWDALTQTLSRTFPASVYLTKWNCHFWTLFWNVFITHTVTAFNYSDSNSTFRGYSALFAHWHHFKELWAALLLRFNNSNEGYHGQNNQIKYERNICDSIHGDRASQGCRMTIQKNIFVLESRRNPLLGLTLCTLWSRSTVFAENVVEL